MKGSLIIYYILLLLFFCVSFHCVPSCLYGYFTNDIFPAVYEIQSVNYANVVTVYSAF